MELHPYKSGLGLMEPVALMQQNVCIHYLKEVYYRTIDFLEAIPPFQAIDIGAIALGTTAPRTAVPNLDMPDDEFGQFRWFPLDNAHCRFWLPGAAGKYTLLNFQGFVDPTIVNKDPCLHLTEFFVWENNRPSIEAMNGMDYPLRACRIVVMGYRFHTVKLTKDVVDGIKAGKEPCTYVWCSAMGT